MQFDYKTDSLDIKESARHKIDLISDIADRAEEMDLFLTDRMGFLMDMTIAELEYSLYLDKLLHADTVSFVHDILGIQMNTDRKQHKLSGVFVPRFARHIKKEE